MKVDRIVQLNALLLTDGQSISLPKDGVLVFVGPNNSGKSAALRAIRALLSFAGSPANSILSGIAFEKLCDTQAAHRRLSRSVAGDSYSTVDGHFAKPDLAHYWQNLQGLGPVTGAVTTTLTTEQRLSDCNPCQNIDLVTQSPTHPFQRMLADRELEMITSDAVRRAFAADLVIDRGAGGLIPAFIGDRPKLGPGEERGDASYSSRVRLLARLQEQGDGLRSFVSIVARVVTEEREILLIDEPEAFLHPPQARLVGRLIAEQNSDRQTFIATHSSDVLQGVLADQSRGVPITVVRLTRSGNQARAVTLEPDDIADLWSDPILRFSNILDGLFHHGVVVAESDADCRFYEALLEVVAPLPRPDLHFCYTGGKDRLHIVIRSLMKLGLPVAAIVDFDLLNSKPALSRIYEAAGGAWDEIEPDWLIVKDAVETKSNFLGGREFVESISAELRRCEADQPVPREVLSRVKKLSRQASPWDVCKRSGLSALRGPGHAAAVRLLGILKLRGIFVVPEGEMEGFVRSLEPKGARWVEEVMKSDVAADRTLQSAREFVEQVADFFQ